MVLFSFVRAYSDYKKFVERGEFEDKVSNVDLEQDQATNLFIKKSGKSKESKESEKSEKSKMNKNKSYDDFVKIQLPWIL